MSDAIESLSAPEYDNVRKRLTERFLSPEDLLMRFYTFHANAEMLTANPTYPDERIKLVNEIHSTRAAQYKEALQKCRDLR